MSSSVENPRINREFSPEVRQLTAAAVLQMDPRPLEIPEDTSILVSPAEREFAASFARVVLKSYEDLRALGFVPRKLSEDKVRQAIAADDDEAYRLAARMAPMPTADCHCNQAHGRATSPMVSSPRIVYGSIRRRHHPTLARVLSDHYGTQFAWDDVTPAIIRTWVTCIQRKPEVVVLLLSDLTIHRNATLTVAPSSKTLMARDIRIHQSGRLIVKGSYLKIWANSLSRLSETTQTTSTVSTNPIWATID